jgi:hypothetical protein
VNKIKLAIFVFIAFGAVFAQDENLTEAEKINLGADSNSETFMPQEIENSAIFVQNEKFTRIGIMNPYTNNEDTLMSQDAARCIRDALHEIGRYDVYIQSRMEDAYRVVGNHFPEYCHEPRCIASLGNSLQLERMIFGEVGFNDNCYFVELKVVDAVSKKVVNQCSFEGKDGAALSDVIKTAIFRIHEIDTLSSPAELDRYFGEKVNNVKPALISTSAYMGLGLLIALLGNDHQNAWARIDEKLSGIDPSMRTVAQSARAKSMGNCYVALAKDAYGAFYNPAGASWIEGPEASVNYQGRYGLLNTISASFLNKATREVGFGHTLIYSGHPESYYMELYFSTLASYRFLDVGKLPPFSIGANINVSSARTTGGSGSEYDQKGTAVGFGLDVGFLIELTDKIDFGFVFNNIPTFTFYNNASSSEKEIGSEIYNEYRYKENSPASVRLGGAFEVSYATLLVAEGEIPLYRDQNWRFAGGIEQQITNIIRIRGGASKNVFTIYEMPWHLTFGGGVQFPIKHKKVDIDVSYELLTDLELRHIWDISFKIDL